MDSGRLGRGAYRNRVDYLSDAQQANRRQLLPKIFLGDPVGADHRDRNRSTRYRHCEGMANVDINIFCFVFV